MNTIEAVMTVAKGIAEAENIFDYEQAYINVREDVKLQGVEASNIDVLTTSSCGMAFEKESDVDIIVCVTENGKIAKFLSKQRTKQPILACSTNG
jgi:pyruvate kinase